jgi:hypothetical protein
MKRFKLRRPSAPMIIAIVALVAALGGTAVAGGGFLKKTKFQNFKKNNNTTLSAKLGGPINYVVQSQTVAGNLTTPTTITANCPSGQHPTGGGVKVEDLTATLYDQVVDQYMTSSGYVAHVINNSGVATTHTFRVEAACVLASSTSGSPPTS